MYFEKVKQIIGNKYEDDFNFICVDATYNDSKIFNNKAITNLDMYYQATSEVILYYYFKKFFSLVEYDQKIVPGNEHDVDIVASDPKLPFKINAEIKTPFTSADNPNDYTFQMVHRYDNKKPEESPYYQGFKKTITSLVDCINKYAKQNIKKPEKINDDMTFKNNFDKAIYKFGIPGNREINVLFICVSTSRMEHYLDIIMNPYTGMLTDNSFMNLDEYKNIEFFVLSNCLESQLKPNNFNCWDESNYINFVIRNGKGEDENQETKHIYLSTLLNDEYPNFYKFYSNYNFKDEAGNDMPKITSIAFDAYLSKRTNNTKD